MLVQLNVGGVRYVTSRMTLLGGGGSSFFSSLVGDTGTALRGAGSFSPAAEPSRRRRKRYLVPVGDGDEEDDAPEPLFIDRNGALFEPILEFLRCGRRDGPPRSALRSRPRTHRRAARVAPSQNTRAVALFSPASFLCRGSRMRLLPRSTGSLPAAVQDDRALLSDLSKEAAYYLIDPLIKHIAERLRVLGAPLAEVWGIKLPSAQGQTGGTVVDVEVPEGREITITRIVRAPCVQGVVSTTLKADSAVLCVLCR